MIKTNLPILFFVIFSSICFRQPEGTVRFTYDVAGNQTSRFYILISNKLSNAKTVDDIVDADLFKSDISDKIKYYPNPVKEDLYIQWINQEDKVVESITIYNSGGQQLLNFKVSESERNTTVNFQNYPSGFFSVELLYSNGERKNLKVIKN